MFTQIPSSRHVVKHKQAWSDPQHRRWLFQQSFDAAPSKALLQWQESNSWDDSWRFVVIVETVHDEGPLEVGSDVTLTRNQLVLRVEVCRILQQKGFKLCALVQVRNFNRYHVKHRRQHEAAQTYLNSDVCADAITRAQLGTFNLCEKAEQIVNEQPSQTAFYEILNDWYPCGHGRCEGGLDWFWSKIHWFVLGLGGFGLLFYFKWVEHQRDMMFTKMSLPLLRSKIAHVD